jgi:hypothetical protein
MTLGHGDHHYQFLARLKSLTVDGVQILGGGSSRASAAVGPINPCPEIILAMDLVLDDVAAYSWYARAFQHLQNGGMVRRVLMPKDRLGRMVYRRHDSKVVVADSVAKTIHAYSSWPTGARPIAGWDDPQGIEDLFAYSITITPRGMEELRMVPASGDTFTPRQVADLLGVDVGTVYGWVRSGRLAAVDAKATMNARNADYIITKASLEAFRARRSPC